LQASLHSFGANTEPRQHIYRATLRQRENCQQKLLRAEVSATKALGFAPSCRDCGLGVRRVVTHFDSMQRVLVVVYNGCLQGCSGNAKNRVRTFRTGFSNFLRVGK
jgi:hypothetical protein